MPIPADLERARDLAFASDEGSARDLLVSLLEPIDAAGRDDLAMEALAQLGEIYLVRTAYDGVAECITRIRECLRKYPDDAIATRYRRRAEFLDAGLAAARGDHDAAAAARTALGTPTDDEHHYLATFARILCAAALCDDDLHHLAVPLWEQVLADIDTPAGRYGDRLLVLAGIGYGGFCVQTGRLAEAEPWLRRAGARAEALGWELDTARAQLERAVAAWTAGDHVTTDALIGQAYPVIARYARANDVSRCWLYMGFTKLASGALEQADQCWEHAERHWRELGRPLPLHRILLQRSWIPIFFGRFDEAVELIAQARALLDEWPRTSWLQYARLDDQLGTVWRADALADLGFDGSGDPDDDWGDVEAKHVASVGATYAETGTAEFRRAVAKLEQAADLKVPAALAVDSVRYSIPDADARSRWAAQVSAPMLAGAFAVAWEWENTALIAELIEYHSARGSFSTDALPAEAEVPAWAGPPVVAVDSEPLLAVVAGGGLVGGPSLTRLGPLPPLRMDPDHDTILGRYRDLARQRYGRAVTTDEPAWPTWP